MPLCLSSKHFCANLSIENRHCWWAVCTWYGAFHLLNKPTIVFWELWHVFTRLLLFCDSHWQWCSFFSSNVYLVMVTRFHFLLYRIVDVTCCVSSRLKLPWIQQIMYLVVSIPGVNCNNHVFPGLGLVMSTKRIKLKMLKA